jgi:fructose-1,6-bisphosphatase II / sedoheptulose-1,7-bisphosphatase
MEKIAIGPGLPKNLVDLDNSVEKNINLICEAKKVQSKELTACILDRPRHSSIIKTLKSMNVKIHFINDGDVTGVISVAEPSSKIDIYMGTGGAPEGVLAAAALSCLDCQMQTRLFFQDDKERKRAKEIGIKNLEFKYNINDMVNGDVIFCASGVTNGDLVRGIVDKGDFFEAETLVLHKSSKTNKIIKNVVKK